jgi:adenine-specific DNA-methyltransferase
MADSLSELERKRIADIIVSGGKVPARFAPSILEGAKEMELVWAGKSDSIEQIVLPFQSIEQIDEPRQNASGSQTLFDFDGSTGRQIGGWSNKLIWGDNKLILSSLARGPMKQEIENAGGLKLVYIDPPFDVGYDFSMDVNVGDDKVSKEPSVIEQFAYRDTWGAGIDSYVSMIYNRLLLIKDLMADDASIFVHCDYRVTAQIKLILDEVFGSDGFRNELIWGFKAPGKSVNYFKRKHNTIWFYAKGKGNTFNGARVPLSQSTMDVWGKHFDSNGQITYGYMKKHLPGWYESMMIKGSHEDDEVYLDIHEGAAALDWWDDIPLLNKQAENLNYPTQKTEKLMERIIAAASNPGDLVADFFCGSGTTLAVAEKLERKWIGADLGRFAIHTSRKRLISVQRERKEKGMPYRSFEILNLGGYERQRYLSSQDYGSTVHSTSLQAEKRQAFERLVLEAYGAQSTNQMHPFSGMKNQVAVFVGEIDSAVTEADVDRCIEVALDLAVTKVDVLGFEFEMGISPRLSDRAKEQGLTLTLRYIPSDVFDSRAVKSGAVQFYEVGYLEVLPSIEGLSVRIKLSDFGVFYRQSDAEETESSLKAGSSKVVIDQGQVLRVSKTKAGVISREAVTSSWEDWIDYWSIDFNFESRPEIIRVIEDGQEVDRKSGRFIFENEWQSFRTVKDRTLEMESSWHAYDKAGEFSIAVKVIDIFGNDTTRVFKVKVGK